MEFFITMVKTYYKHSASWGTVKALFFGKGRTSGKLLPPSYRGTTD